MQFQPDHVYHLEYCLQFDQNERWPFYVYFFIENI